MTTDEKDGQLFDLPDQNQKIYRILDYNYLKDLFTRKKLYLLRTSKWEDPYENILLKIRIVNSSGEKVCHRHIFDIFFGQCWSFNEEETDAIWRIYSPNRNGVKISTTINKLFTATQTSTDRKKWMSVFVGKVKYRPMAAIVKEIQDPHYVRNIVQDAKGYSAARCLLTKRQEFEHEKEVRLLVRDLAEHVPIYNPHFKMSVDPYTLIDDIIFDP